MSNVQGNSTLNRKEKWGIYHKCIYLYEKNFRSRNMSLSGFQEIRIFPARRHGVPLTSGSTWQLRSLLFQRQYPSPSLSDNLANNLQATLSQTQPRYFLHGDKVTLSKPIEKRPHARYMISSSAKHMTLPQGQGIHFAVITASGCAGVALLGACCDAGGCVMSRTVVYYACIVHSVIRVMRRYRKKPRCACSWPFCLYLPQNGRSLYVDQLVRTRLPEAPCGLRGCKNRPALFPGRMS